MVKKLFSITLSLVAIFTVLTVARVWADEYTTKTQHDSGDPVYKHSNRSFTSPFDYAPCVERAPRPVKQVPQPPSNKCNQFTFDASKSYDLDKQQLAVRWDFGDGSTSDQPVVTHTYEKAGEYNVILTVKDNSGLECDSNVAVTKVRANYPPVVSAGDPARACLGEVVSFDASKTQASAPGKYTWDFGDGTAGDGIVATHVYEKPGSYRVALTVDDGLGTNCSTGVASTTAQIGDRPTVSVTGPEASCTGKSVAFTAQSVSSAGLKYNWDFGDGSTWSGGSTANHRYEKGGEYTVTVTADNGQGFACSTAVSSTRIRVNSAPIADAGQNFVCCVGKETEFDGSKSHDADGSDALSYHWDFGDGESAEGARVAHAYQKNGTYRVVLTVKDNSGSECGVATASFVGNVNARPEAVLEVR